MKIQLEVSDKNECTDSPYWLVLDPEQNMSCCPHQMAGTIEGPFFSREEAEEYLKQRRYAYSDRAVVYCLSGYRSRQYREQYRLAETSMRRCRNHTVSIG